jgi:hypothetical protein
LRRRLLPSATSSFLLSREGFDMPIAVRVVVIDNPLSRSSPDAVRHDRLRTDMMPLLFSSAKPDPRSLSIDELDTSRLKGMVQPVGGVEVDSSAQLSLPNGISVNSGLFA